MKKNILLTIITTGLLLTHTACDDGKDEYLSDFSTILYFRNSGELPVTVYKIGENTEYDLIVNKAGTDLGATASAVVTTMSDATLEAYNTSAGYNYKALPSTCYTYENWEIVFSSADFYKVVTVSMDPELLEQNIGTDATYVIPFEITNGSDSINVEKQYAFIVPTVETPSVGFSSTGFTMLDDITGDSGTITVTQTITMPMNNQWDFECTVVVDEDLLDQYNLENNRSYRLLSSDAYSMEISSFVAGTNTATVSITIDISQLDWGIQALPLRLTGASNENFIVDSNSATCIIGLNYTVARSELTQIPLSLDMLSSNATVDYDGTGLAGLFDGRGSGLHWHSDYSGTIIDAVYGHYIDFQLPSAMNHFAYNFWTRYENSNGAPVNTVIYASNDGDSWWIMGEVTNSFTAGDEEYDSGVFSSADSFTYIRFSVTESNAGNVCTGSYWNCGEMQIFGK